MSSQYERWCWNATFTQKEIDEINRHRMDYAIQNGLFYQPYIPLMCEEGPIVRPEPETSYEEQVAAYENEQLEDNK